MQMMSNICIKQPAAIYYAGRGASLPGFLAALAGRPCPQLKIGLFTGSTAVNLMRCRSGASAPVTSRGRLGVLTSAIRGGPCE